MVADHSKKTPNVIVNRFVHIAQAIFHSIGSFIKPLDPLLVQEDSK